MNELETARTSVSLWRRLLWIFGVPGLAFLIVAAAVHLHHESRSAGELAAAVAGLDETDPGWRLEDLEAARVRLKEKDNSAALCAELASLLGPNWPDPKVTDRLKDVPLGELLDARQKVILEDEMARLEPVRRIARKMVALPRGRHKVEYPIDPTATLAPEQVHLPKVEALFDLEMRQRANEGDVAEAVRACRARVCVARSLYDELLPCLQMLRCRIVGSGLDGVELSLALGESNGAELAALDALLADEGGHNPLRTALRGQRALTYLLYKRTASGEISADRCADLLRSEEWSAFGRLLGRDRRQLRRRIPGMLWIFTRAVENAGLPTHEQPAAEAALESEAGEHGEDAAVQLPGIRELGAACRLETASVAAMRGLIAVERYRMKYKKWPARLGDVVPEFLSGVPADPFDGKPLKMARLRDGVAVYSVGENGVDDGGKFRRDRPGSEDIDIGYRLWDIAKRRRPPSPPKKSVEREP